MSPKGVGKKSPQMLYPNSEVLFDANNDLYGLAIDMVEYMGKLTGIFCDSLEMT